MEDRNPEPFDKVNARLKKLEDDLARLRQAVGQQQPSQTPVNELAARVDTLASRTAGPHPLRPYFFSAITASSGADHSWQEQYVTDSGVIDFTGGRAASDRGVEIQGWENVPDTAVTIMFCYDIPGSTQYAFMLAPPPPPDQSGATDYILGYDGATQQYKWYEQNTCTPPE